MWRFLALSLAESACLGSWEQPLVNFCEENWPKKRSALSLVMFHSPRCGHCLSLQTIFQQLAQDSAVPVGGVECPEPANFKLCKSFNVTGYPTVYGIGFGQVERYQGPASLKGLQRFLGRLAARKRLECAGVLEPPVARLCKEHFPNTEAKHPWLVVLHNQRHGGGLAEPAKAAAEDLSRLTRRERLQALKEKYVLKVRVPLRGLEGSKAFAKVGAVCCDCEAEARKLCRRLAEGAQLPALLWVASGRTEVSARSPFSARELVAVALGHLGLLQEHPEL